MTEKKNYTFIELFGRKNLCIKIPTIQRDYAQGRLKEDKVRNKFLKNIKGALLESKILNLDFIYGNIDDSNEEKEFIPIDGQQRLTTLFLIHWYLAIINGEAAFGNFKHQLTRKNGFSKFSYHTRSSAKEFCDALLGANFYDFFSLKTTNDFSATIKSRTWFYSAWLSDPTVKSMVYMLGEIHKEFFDKKEESLDNLFKGRYITFEFLNLKDLKLTDDLYIKMNSRGKPLTEFENFKADLNKLFETKYKGDEKSRITDFFIKLDNAWNDAFWCFSRITKIQYDAAFMNYFNFLGQMLFYLSLEENKGDEVYSKENILSVFEIEANLNFLEKALDLLSNSFESNENAIEAFFQKFLSENYAPYKVAFFDKGLNLFQRCISDKGFSHKEKLLFFVILYWQIESGFSILTVTENFKDFFRICRNIVLSIVQSKKDEFVSDLRETNYYELLNSFKTLYSKDNVYQHLDSYTNSFKASKGRKEEEFRKSKVIVANSALKSWIHKLEDHYLIKGALHNFGITNLITESELENLVETFYEMWDLSNVEITDVLRAKAILSIGDYSQKISNSAFGEVWYFGNGWRWNRILTANNSKVNNTLSVLFQELNASKGLYIKEKIEELVQGSLKRDDMSKWRRTFLKFPRILEKTYGDRISFAFRGYEDERIEKMSGTTLRSNHINIYVEAVILQLNKPELIGWETSFRKNSEESYLRLPNEVLIYPFEGEWHIYNIQGIKNYETLIVDFELIRAEKNEKIEYFKLRETTESDFVERCVEFIQKAYS